MVSTADSFRDITDIKSHLANLTCGSNVDHADSNNEASDHLLKPDALLLRQRLQTLCRTVLLNNLEASLDHKIETDLWNFAFKAQITALQQATKVKASSTKRAEVQADCTLFLESALGFYMQLLEDICETFHLHPNFRRKYSSFGIIQGRSDLSRRSHSRFPSKASSMYICQYCLVHLGDVARYLQRISLAENFYNLASRYVPSNGQPYNQLAILCSTRSNKLAVTYYYIRSIAVRSPFPVAPTNLEKLYSKQIKDCENTNFVSKNKWTHGEIVTVFLYLQALVHLEADKEKAGKLSELLYRCLCSQTIFSLLTAQNTTHMVAISLFTLCHLDDTGEDKSITDDEKHFRDVTVGFIASFLEVLLSQAQKYNVREHMTLPAIKVILEWLSCREGYLSNSVVKTHRCWLNLAKVLNAIQSHCKDPKTLDLSKWTSVPLPEDVELQCFLPLADTHEPLDFNLMQTLKMDPADVTRVRCKRLVDLGKTLTEKYPSLNLIDFKVNSKNTKIIFSAPTTIKVEPSRTKAAYRNVAIQALKSQETTPLAIGTAPQLLLEELPVWPIGSPGTFSLTSTPESSYAAGLDNASSYSSFQSDVAPVGTGVQTPPGLPPFGLATPPSPAEEFTTRRNTQVAGLGGMTHHHGSQGVIGSEVSNSKSRTLAELIDATHAADPAMQPMSFSASDSSVFTSQGYSLFSSSFSLAAGPAAVTDTSPGDGGASLGSNALAVAAAFLPQSSTLSSSTGWPSSSAQGSSSTSENTWGYPPLLALLEEQQKRQQQASKQLEGENSWDHNS